MKKNERGGIWIVLVIVILLLSFSALAYSFFSIYFEMKSKEKAVDIKVTEMTDVNQEKSDEALNSLKKSLELSYSENAALSGKLKELTASLDALKKDISEKNSQIGFFSAERGRLESVIKDTQTAYETKITNIDGEKAKIAKEAEETRAKAKEQEAVLSEKINALENELGILLNDKNNLEQVVSKMSKDALVKETAKIHFNMGNQYVESQRYRQAIKEYERAAQLRPDDPDIHYNLALVYDIYTEDDFAALKNYKRVLEINPRYKKSKMIEDRIVGLSLQEGASISPTLAKETRKNGLMMDNINTNQEATESSEYYGAN